MADNAILTQLKSGYELQESIRREYKQARRDGSFADLQDKLIESWRAKVARWHTVTEDVLARSADPIARFRFRNTRGSAQVAAGENMKWSGLDNLLRAKLDMLHQINKETQAQTEKAVVFNIQHSVVGSVNLAPVLGNLEVSVSALQRSGQDDLARSIKDLVEKISDASGLSPDERREALELTNTLSEELNKGPSQRSKATIKTITSALAGILTRVSELATIWQVIQHFLP